MRATMMCDRRTKTLAANVGNKREPWRLRLLALHNLNTIRKHRHLFLSPANARAAAPSRLFSTLACLFAPRPVLVRTDCTARVFPTGPTSRPSTTPLLLLLSSSACISGTR